jgi:formylglycine-generating enzyme required for sulfatase activity
MLGFVIAVLICNGSNCDMLQAEPGVSYPDFETCSAALTAKSTALDEFASRHRPSDRSSNIICMTQIQTIVEVEEPFEVLDTAIVHTEPGATSLYVGTVEKGQRTLVTGIVSGTRWLRVLLPEGKTGFVFGDRLRKVGGERQAPSGPGGPTTFEALPQLTESAPAPVSQIGSDDQAKRSTMPTEPPAFSNAGIAQSSRPPLSTPRVQSETSNMAAASSPPVRPADLLRSGDIRDCETCPIMVPIAGGEYLMGSDADRSEKPLHSVRIGPFAMGKIVLTVSQWDACVSAGGCQYKPIQSETTPEQRPMTNLSWDDAIQYVQWLAARTGKPYRLPSEAEWEYAARAGTNSRYTWGDQVGIGKANCNGCGGPRDPLHSANVASYAPNAWGLYDVQGGVAEWVEDCWHGTYQGAPADGTPWRSSSCSKHVLRGGSWNSPPSDITVSSRNFYDANVRYPANGVRIALTMQ